MLRHSPIPAFSWSPPAQIRYHYRAKLVSCLVEAICGANCGNGAAMSRKSADSSSSLPRISVGCGSECDVKHHRAGTELTIKAPFGAGAGLAGLIQCKTCKVQFSTRSVQTRL